jgi:hypothetical protein
VQKLDWNDASQPVPSGAMKKVIEATSTLHKLMVQTLDGEQLELVFCEIGIGLSNKIPAAYAVIPLSSLTPVGKDRFVNARAVCLCVWIVGLDRYVSHVQGCG